MVIGFADLRDRCATQVAGPRIAAVSAERFEVRV
jgi:hypothetical protein